MVGGTAYTDRLEDDRSFGQTELKGFGINIIPFEELDRSTTRSRSSRRIRRATSSSQRRGPEHQRRSSSARTTTGPTSSTCWNRTRRVRGAGPVLSA